jgi:hypothetical protein
MGLPEREKAAKLLAKGKLILWKELPKLDPRVRKWDDIVSDAKDHDDNGAAAQAFDAYSSAGDLARWVKRMALLIKRTALLSDTDKEIGTFFDGLRRNLKEADKSFKTYKSEKGRFVARFGKEEWSAKMVKWVRSDRPNFDVAFKIFQALVKIKV